MTLFPTIRPDNIPCSRPDVLAFNSLGPLPAKRLKKRPPSRIREGGRFFSNSRLPGAGVHYTPLKLRNDAVVVLVVVLLAATMPTSIVGGAVLRVTVPIWVHVVPLELT